MAFEWTDLITPGLTFGGSVLSSSINAGANKADTKESARQFDIRTQRADQARSALMPNLMANLGRKPSLGMMPGQGGYYGAYSPQMQQQGGGGSTLGTVLKAGMSAAPLALKLAGIGGKAAGGLAGTAATGIGGKILGMAGGPIGMAAATLAPMAIKAIKNIGAGRKAADRLTGAQGAQGQFGAIMGEVAKREGAGQITPEQREQMLAQALDHQINAGMSQIKNEKDKLVMRQWLGDFFRPEWQRDHPGLAGVAQKYLGSLA